VIGVDEGVPDPSAEPDGARSKAMTRAITYLGLTPGQPMEGLAVDVVFNRLLHQ